MEPIFFLDYKKYYVCETWKAFQQKSYVSLVVAMNEFLFTASVNKTIIFSVHEFSSTFFQKKLSLHNILQCFFFFKMITFLKSQLLSKLISLEKLHLETAQTFSGTSSKSAVGEKKSIARKKIGIKEKLFSVQNHNKKYYAVSSWKKYFYIIGKNC